MKKIIKTVPILLVAAIVMSLFSVLPVAGADGTTVSVWNGDTSKTLADLKGTGTRTDPYLISDGAELYAAVAGSHNAKEIKYFSITNDIYLNSVENDEYKNWDKAAPANEWTDSEIHFTGVIDGNGYTVYGLYVNKNGLSGFVDQLNGPSSIKNLNIRKSCIAGGNYTGAFAGYMSYGGAVISGCTAAEVKVTSTGCAAGGIAGRMEANAIISDSACYDAALSSGGNNERSGGIAGNGWKYNSLGEQRSITNCFSAGYVPVGTLNNIGWFKLTNVYSDDIESVSGVTVLKNSEMQGSEAVKKMSLSEDVWTATDSYPVYKAYYGEKGKVWSGKTAYNFSDGNGTEQYPYIIETGEQLRKAICDLGKTNGAPTYYLITEDIYLNDITKVADWATAAPANNWYSDSLNQEWIGNIDGGGHTVYGLYSSTDDAKDPYNKSASLIQRFAGGATVKNLHIRDSYLYAPNASASAFFGTAKRLDNSPSNVVLSGCSADESVLIRGYVAGGLFAVPQISIKVENSWFACSDSTLVNTGGTDSFKGGLYGNRWAKQTIDIKNTYFDGCPPYYAGRTGNAKFTLNNVYQINIGDQTYAQDYGFKIVNDYSEMSGLDTSEWYWIEDGRPLLKNRGKIIYDIDADDDEALDAGDLAALRKNLLSVSGYENIISDVNGDEKTDIIDLIALKKAVLNFEKKN